MVPADGQIGGADIPVGMTKWVSIEAGGMTTNRRMNECNDLRTMDQLEELRGCDERLTAGMLDRLGDLRR